MMLPCIELVFIYKRAKISLKFFIVQYGSMAWERQGNGMGTAWERHGMCQSNTTALCQSNGKDTI
jgi:hypothetical protein